jgi:hypothetical protein
MHSVAVWAKGLLAASIAGAANGVITGFAAVGIDPAHFNLQAGLKPTLAIAGVSAAMSGLIGAAAYLKQSPLPSDGPIDRGREGFERPRTEGIEEGRGGNYAGRRNDGV